MIYLDHAATTPVDPRVAEAMTPFLQDRFGNPSSIHGLGRDARAALDTARESVARAIGAEFSEVCFTSGGTESDNLALTGAMLAAPPHRRRLIVSAVEHHAVLHTARFLESLDYSVTRLPVDAEGFVDPSVLEAEMTDSTALVSILHANNEIGTIQDIPRLARIARSRGALFHTDAVQSFGYLPVNVAAMGVDLASFSAHKIYGPKGTGALYVRSGVRLSPLLWGGAQERERRAGTENVAGIVGFGVAVSLLAEVRDGEAKRQRELRDRFIRLLEQQIPDIRLNGPRIRRLPNNVNVSIPGVDGAAALMSLDIAGIAASSGSACSSGSIEPSHVLTAIGLPKALAASGIRFTLGRGTTEEELLRAAEALSGIVKRLRR